MYTIGKFSKLVRMTPRMLRHYDQEGILKPARIDDNQYRYYNVNQIDIAVRIRHLKDLKFSLEEIRMLIQNDDPVQTKGIYESKINDLSDEIELNSSIIKALNYDTKYLGQQPHINSYQFDILMGISSDKNIFAIRTTLNTSEIDDYFDELYEKAEELEIKLLNVPGAIFYSEEYTPERSDVLLFAPILNDDANYEGTEYEIINSPDELIVSTIYYGNYDDIGFAVVALEKWIEENKYEIVGDMYELYLKSSECGCPQYEYITQVCFPIEKIK